MNNFQLCQGHLKHFCASVFVSALITGCGGGGGGDTHTDQFDAAAAASSSAGAATDVVASSAASTKSSAALNSSSSSSQMATDTSNSPDAAPPQAPYIFIATDQSTNMVTIQWTASDDDVGVVRYKIYRDQVQIDTADGFDSSYTDYTVTGNKTYTYGISAGDAAGNWSQLKVTTAQTLAKSVSSSSATQQPTSSMSSAASFTSAPVSSTASNSSQTSSAKSISSAIANSTASKASSSNSSSSLTISSSASTMSSANSSQASSSAASLGDTTAPSAPGSINNDIASYDRGDISWAAATDNVAVTQYTLYRDSLVLAVLDGNTLNFSDTSVSASQQYQYEVAAGDAADNWSAKKSILVTTPAVVSATDLSWNHPDHRENLDTLAPTDIGGYEIRYKRPSERSYTYVTLLGNKTTSFSVVSLSGDTNFEIACFDVDGRVGEFAAIALK